MPTKASKHVLLAMLSLAVSGCALNYVIDEHAFRRFCQISGQLAESAVDG